MLRELRVSFMMLLVLTIVTGVVYPLAVWGIGQVVFREQAEGSLISQGGHVRGSALVGQAFEGERWFWGRPSATTPAYDASHSGGSNLGPTNPDLVDAIRARVDRLRAAPGGDRPIPIDLVTASGSGLDPHVSPNAALFQVPRVAKARGLDPDRVRQLVLRFREGPTLGFLGEARVNVLNLNLALDRLR